MNYPTVPPLDLEFTLTIEKANTFVFIPPIIPDEEEEKPEPELEDVEPEFVFVPDFDFLKPKEEVEKVLTKADIAANSLRVNVAEDQQRSPDPIPSIKRTTATGLVEIVFS